MMSMMQRNHQYRKRNRECIWNPFSMNLSLSWRLTQALNPKVDKNQIRTKKYDMPRMQRFELSLNDMVKLLTSRAPLDSTVIYPITRSPNNTMRPVK